MTLDDYKLTISFLEHVEALTKAACDVKDGKYLVSKTQLISYLENRIKEENARNKLYQDDVLCKKLETFYAATMDLIK